MYQMMLKKTYDAKSGNYNKKNNYTITFKIDEDLKDYFKNIEKITFIENLQHVQKFLMLTKVCFLAIRNCVPKTI